MGAPSAPAPAPAPAVVTNPRAQRLLDAFGHEPCDLDTLAACSELPVAEIGALLTQLELDGLIATLPGGLVQRLHR